MAGQLLSRQLTHDLFTAAFLPALDITTQCVSPRSSVLCCHHGSLYPLSPVFSLNTQCPCPGCSLLSSRSLADSEAPSLAAAHHWTAHPQLWSPALRSGPDTQKLVTTRHDSFPPVSRRPGPSSASVWTCGAAPAQPAQPAASTNMKSKFDSGSGGCLARRPQCGGTIRGRVSPESLLAASSYSGTQAPRGHQPGHTQQ